MASVALFILSVLAHLVVLHWAEYSKAESIHCPGQFCSDIVGNIRFPFKSPGDPPECGLFTVNCSEPDRPKIQLKEGGYMHEFQGSLASTSIFIIHIFINDTDLADRLEKDSCSDEVFDDLSLPSASPIPQVSLFTHNLTLLKCNTTLGTNSYPQFTDSCRNRYHAYYIASPRLPSPPPPGCTTSQVPIPPSQPQPYSFFSLTGEFSLEVSTPECSQCSERKGECLVEEGKFKCTRKGDKQLNLKLGLVGAASVIVFLVVVCCFFWKKRIQKHQIVEAFLRSYGPLQVQRHSYSEVKKMTYSFKEKLGQGGYGAVYKGKLKDGRLVAVKCWGLKRLH